MQDDFVRVLGGEGETHAHDCACARCVDMNGAIAPAAALPEAA